MENDLKKVAEVFGLYAPFAERVAARLGGEKDVEALRGEVDAVISLASDVINALAAISCETAEATFLIDLLSAHAYEIHAWATSITQRRYNSARKHQKRARKLNRRIQREVA